MFYVTHFEEQSQFTRTGRDSIETTKLKRVPPVSDRTAYIAKLLAEGAQRLLARAGDPYSLSVGALVPRVRASLEKYLLRDLPEASVQAIVDFLDKLQASDLCLAVACESGDAAAWDDLVGRYSTTVRSAARSTAGNEDAAEDLAQSIWAELHGLRLREDGRPASKLAYYSGCGSLAGWLRAVVGQLAVDQHRKQSRLVQMEDDTEFDRLPGSSIGEQQTAGMVSPAPNPESALSNKRERVEMEQALARSIKQMADEDRLLVKLYYFDNLRLREAGAVLGVHEATASRRLTRIHGELRKQTEHILTNECGWSKAEAESAFAALALHMESDLEPLLSSNVVREESRP
jgi:RNA polymerase sigma-70 factor